MINNKKWREIIWKLFNYLRRFHFPVDIQDYEALYNALLSGFGWNSKDDFIDVCCALLAKSTEEQDVIKTFYNQIEFPDWTLRQKEKLIDVANDTKGIHKEQNNINLFTLLLMRLFR